RKTAPLSACEERSQRIVARLESLDVLARARRVALFWPILERREVDLRALDASLRLRGAHVAYPAVDPETRVMTFKWALPADLRDRGLGFEEPAPEAATCVRGEIEVIIVPAIAFAPS